MDKVAVIKTGGKQYKVIAGQILKIEKILAEANDKVKFDTLLISSADGSDLKLGKPTLGELVEGKVVEQGRAEKVSVIKYKRKTRYKKNVGHRQPYTKVQIEKIK